MPDWNKYTPPIYDEHYAATKSDEPASSGNSDVVMWPEPISAKTRLPDVGNFKPPEQGWLVWSMDDGWRIENIHPQFWNTKDRRGKFYDGPVVEFWMEKPPEPLAT